MKQKMSQCIQATRKHFAKKGKCTQYEYFGQLEKEMRTRGMENAADILHTELVKQVRQSV